MRYFFTLALLLTFTTLKAAKVDTVNVYSAAMHKNIPCVVIQPEPIKSANHKLPVVYLLHGWGGSYKTWVNTFPNIKADADAYQIIIVCPDGAVGSWYLDSPVDSTFRYETFVAKELVNYIDDHYGTLADKKHRAIAGLSMGGHGAFYLGLKHKELYGAISSISGGVDIRPFPNNWDLKKRLGTIEEHPENWEKNTVINVVDSLKNKELSISFDCGVNDFFIEVNRALNAKLLKMGIDHDYTERPGAHTSEYWSNSISYTLLFFYKYFNN